VNQQQLWASLEGLPHAPARHSVLCAALSDLGAQEQPPRSNSGPQIDHLVRGIADYWWSDLIQPDWCAAAVSHWVRRGLGLADWDRRRVKPFAPSIEGHPWGQWFVGCKQLWQWSEEHPETQLSEPEPGAVWIIGHKRGDRQVYQHTGLVLSVHPDEAQIQTIEGNLGSEVASRRMGADTPICYIAWWAVL